mmetsp:Transcript_26393/g.29200  ORF Transcript_26393/g.29200 Transcript_26393/m.29200 type:complete len:239 (+) Transcript_26393:29-745(+)
MMLSSASSILSISRRAASRSQQLLSCITTRQGHTTRVILTSDVSNGININNKAGEILDVKAGYARNCLIPQKLALYAIPENFDKLGIKDPTVETLEERRERILAEEEASRLNTADKDLEAANLLTKYLGNKVLKIWRNVDSKNSQRTSPGMVDQLALREKLSRQLRIDLKDEQIHISETAVRNHDDYDISEEDLKEIMDKIETKTPCKEQIRELGSYMAKISLTGEYTVPLKFVVLKR